MKFAQISPKREQNVRFFRLAFLNEKNDRKMTIPRPLGVPQAIKPDLAGKRKALI